MNLVSLLEMLLLNGNRKGDPVYIVF
jgi:hypothetical protein